MHTTNDLRETISSTATTTPQSERQQTVETPLPGSGGSALQITVERRVRLGRRPKYHSKELGALLFQCWLERERMCSKRLVIQLAAWLEAHEQAAGPVAEPLRSTFLSLSHASIDRVLKPMRDRWYEQASAQQ